VATIQKLYFHDASSPLSGTLPPSTTESATAPTKTATGAGTNRAMDGTAGSSQVGPTLSSNKSTTKQNNWWRRFLSAPIAGQTLGSGTWTIRAAIKTSNTSSAWKVSACVYVWRPSNGTLVGRILDAVTTGVGTSAGTGETDTTAVALSGTGSNVTASDGDILVVEVWGSVTQSSTTSRTWSLYYDGTTEGSTASNAAYILAPAAITLLAPVAVGGAESISEADRLTVSANPHGAGAVSEAGVLAVSERPPGAESITELGAVKVSAKPPGAERLGEEGSVAAPVSVAGAESPSEAGTLKVSARPPGSERLAEIGTSRASAAPPGAEHVTESGAAAASVPVDIDEAISILAALALSQHPTGAASAAETGSVTVSAAPGGQESPSESGTAALSSAPAGGAALAEAAAATIVGANPVAVAGIVEVPSLTSSALAAALASLAVTGAVTPSGSVSLHVHAGIYQTATLVVTNPPEPPRNPRQGGGASGSSAARMMMYRAAVARGDYGDTARLDAVRGGRALIDPKPHARYVALAKEQIEGLFSRVPVLRPPPSVFILGNADIGAERLYDSVHRFNTTVRERWHILGMHERGTPFVLIAGDAPELTAIHEAVHYNGVANERATRIISRALYARSQLNLGLRVRPVTYSVAPVGPAEEASFLRSMRLENPSGGNVELVHLVYTPG
jgi:hypothetical protein